MVIMHDLVIIGAGGFGREVFWLVDRINRHCPSWRVLGFLDDNLTALDSFDGYPRILGNVAHYGALNRPHLACAIGHPKIRRAVVDRLAQDDVPWATLVDPTVSFGPGSTMGRGCIFLKNANVTTDVTIGDHVHFGCAAQAGHDSSIGNYSTLCGHVDVNGGAMVEEGVFIGSHGCILPRMRVEAWSTVGGGTVPIRTVRNQTTVFGVPAKEIGGTRPAAPPRIYLSPPHMSDDDRAMLLDAFDSNWIAPSGPDVDAFEREFAAKVGVPDAVSLSSGTAALHLAMVLLGVGPGDEVLTSTLTFVATANAIRYCGAAPIFIDSDAATWNLDPALLTEEIEDCVRRGKSPKAVLAIDLYGQCADYEAIRTVCARYDIPLVEDAAEALGASYRGRPAGVLGDIGCYSFNGNKVITTSGGGMLIARDSKLVCKARFLATQAREPVMGYEHREMGYNYRLSNLLAAVGRGQLRVLDARVAQRRANNDFYRQALGDLPGISFMPRDVNGRSNCWLTCVIIDPDRFGADREQVRQALEADNIEARPVWKPMHLQPLYSGCRTRGGDVASRLFYYGLCLPSGSNLSPTERQRVVDVIRTVARA